MAGYDSRGSAEQPKPAISVQHLAADKRREIGEDDGREVAPHAELANIFPLTESQPEQGTLSHRRKGFGDDQIDRSRTVSENERQRQRHDRVRACRQSHAGKEFPSQRVTARKSYQ